ncbi:LD-carboxypeptidase [Psychrobacter urativorans]|uniref:Muramoyltetrapeptide carboxypeptidase n=1 Tax=Psychrobacter urativorans TaxID=45610 RepID=A0A0M4T6G8_9GAMM|nr:LD-carboxypeptidase [Psychrobacter urativorans]ALF59034.1 muramoyltetrapeptide carboxypeptidase [Psychrobacter urativorans]
MKRDTKTAIGLNRRQFLHRVGMSAGLLVTQNITQTLAATTSNQSKNAQLTKDDLPMSLMNENSSSQPLSQSSHVQANCIVPSIETRLFASSNAGSNNARNELALARLECAGFKVANPTIVSRQYLRFAGTDGQRASDLQNIATGAIAAPKLLLGVRGGYGAMRLLPMIDWQTLGRVMKERGTILAGFSDVTAIQCALLAKGGMSSLAAPMLYSEFGKTKPDELSCKQFVEALSNPNLSIEVKSAELTSKQLPIILATGDTKTIIGKIWGGNLSVVSALAGSDYLPRIEGGIVFLEDVGEQPYRIERMLYDLYLAGVFKGQQAVVFGALSGTGEDSYDARYDVATVVRQLHKLTGLPIYNGMGFGHIERKQSFPLGARCQISVNTQGSYTLKFADYPTIKGDSINVQGLLQA